MMRTYRTRNVITEGLDPTLGAASYNVQGKGPGYVYRVLPLTRDLEQKANKVDDRYYIYPGCMVTGTGYNNPSKHYTGMVTRIVKNSDGEVEFIYIKTVKNNKFVTINVDDELTLILNSEPDYNYPQVSNTLPGIMTQSNNMRL